ncbi:2-hydroxychromene-2-carboxylate isomerase [Hoeflea marina]|uniref:2-hydroxychromene-2-carboxylate isomerase n=1 Tax=Hoeflea marina TaxID=274592 RepID=A0A317PKG3_9HYPH|nr:DsbA family protein [Hoeflea marina]PWW00366.1 2-hydroxychromene-2-carboxylate isomerase [Hoeflea marina]
MGTEITFHYDILSPFAHVALARLDELPAGCVIVPRPVLLGALLSHWGQRGPAEIAPKRLHTYRIAAFLGERHGLAMRFPPRHPFNPLAGLRILAGANGGAGADLAMVRRAFDFVFRQGRAPDNALDLEAFAAAVGAPAELAGDDAAKAALRRSTEEAISLGVFGVPSFVVDTASGPELFWGVDAFDMLKAFLADREMFSREPFAHLGGIEVGVERK